MKPIHIFHLPEGPDIEAIQPGDQGVVEGSGLCTLMKDGCDRGGVVEPKPGPSGASSVPPQRPTWMKWTWVMLNRKGWWIRTIY